MAIGHKSKGPGVLQLDEHQQEANAKKCMTGILVPGTVVSADISAAGVYVGKGNIIKIRVLASAGAVYVAFGISTIGAVSSTTSPATEIIGDTAAVSSTFLVAATDDYIRASANPARVEVISG